MSAVPVNQIGQVVSIKVTTIRDVYSLVETWG